MKAYHFSLVPLVALATACAAPAYVSPVEVTRFVGTQPAALGTGSISIVMAPGMDEGDADLAPYRAALATELASLGYRVVATGGGQEAQLTLTQAVQAPEGRRGPVSVGAGGSTGTYGSGVGLGVGINLSGPPPERIERTVAVAIRPVGGGANLWEGRAGMTATANSDYAETDAAAARIIDALFAGFPGTSGETIEVE